VPKRTIDDLLDAIETIAAVKQTLLNHERSIQTVSALIESLERRVTALETDAKS
jgi:phage shock protein A